MTRFFRIYIGLILLIGIAIRLYFIFNIGYFREDALITLRYGVNFWEGKGMVFNPGERVLAATSPLWTLITGFIDYLFPIDTTFTIVNLISLVCFMGITQLVWVLLAHYPVPVRAVAITLLQLHPLVIAISVSGMETSLFMLLIFSSMYAAYRNNFTLSFAMAALTALTRPEGAIWSITLGLYTLYATRTIPWRGLALYAIITIPWLLFATEYYGSPIPQSAIAKAGDSNTIRDYLWHPFDLLLLWFNFSGLRMFLELPTALTFVITSAWLICGIAGLRYAYRHPAPMLAGGFFLFYWMFYYFGRPSVFDWYHVPGIMVYILFASIPLGLWLNTLPIPNELTLSITAIAILFFLPGSIEYDRFMQRYEDEVRRPVGYYLAECTSPGSTVLMEPIGYIGYLANRKVIDMAGLVTPEFARPYGDGNWIVSTIQSFNPDYLVLRTFEISENSFFAQKDQPFFKSEEARSWFLETYRLEKAFPWKEAPRLGFQIYRRNNLAVPSSIEKQCSET